MCLKRVSIASFPTATAAHCHPIAAAIYGIYCAWTLAAAIANSLGDELNIRLNQLGGMLNLVGAVVLAVVLPAVATEHQPASYVFGHFERAQAEAVGITSPA